ncbi:hypothetical protein K438DRAFT_1953786 [Mycena galopus ATCC 62051]|nr:hypothetical protein K438DRAFT_1953786 [Mycena galopus ATCC 62051]
MAPAALRAVVLVGLSLAAAVPAVTPTAVTSTSTDCIGCMGGRAASTTLLKPLPTETMGKSRSSEP